MHIIIITPAPPGSRAGNRATALRWQHLLQLSGHRVDVVTRYKGEPCDLFIALHAWRSHQAVRDFHDDWPDHPLIVALTGTDVYRHQFEFPEETLASMRLADALIGLHSQVAKDIPAEFRARLIALKQSAPDPSVAWSANHSDTDFKVCVIGHLRDEKDSLLTARAARLLPESSQVRVCNAGKANDDSWQRMAEEEAAENPRFQWIGEVGQSDIESLMLSSQAMVISSVMEGGANVVSEACRMGIPILASDIPGNRGLLGDDYSGYFKAQDTKQLAALLAKAENDPGFLATLASQVAALAPEFTPERESASLDEALTRAIEHCSERQANE